MMKYILGAFVNVCMRIDLNIRKSWFQEDSAFSYQS
jgi:hypothetical protein